MYGTTLSSEPATKLGDTSSCAMHDGLGGESMNDKSNGRANGGVKSNEQENEIDPGRPENGAEKDDSKFDWVTKRSSCSLPKVFAVLRQQVEEDVRTRNALRPSYAPYEFSLAEDIDKLKVLLKAKDLEKSVTFNLGERAISVEDDKGNKMFQVTLTFSDKGACKLNVNEKELEFWQVRRMALEDLMFRQE